MHRKTHTIDAVGKALGRLATEIAALLIGKGKPNFAYNVDEGDFIIVRNVDKIKFTGSKIDQKKYFRHTKYLGGVKETPLKKLFAEAPSEVLKKAVWGMLPKNKLRTNRIKRLTFE